MVAASTIAASLRTGYKLSREAATQLDENQEKVAEIATFLSDTGIYQRTLESAREANKKSAKMAPLPVKAAQKVVVSQMEEVESYEEIIDETYDAAKDEKKVAEYGARIVDILSKGEGTMSEQLNQIDNERQEAERTNDRSLLQKAFSDEIQEMKEVNKEAELAVEAISLILRLSDQVERLSEEERKEIEMKKEDHENMHFLEQLDDNYDVDSQVIEKIENIESKEESAVQRDENEIEEVIQLESETLSKLETEIDQLLEDLENTIEEMDALENDIQSASFEFPELEEQLQESRRIAEKNTDKLEEAKQKAGQIENNIEESKKALP